MASADPYVRRRIVPVDKPAPKVPGKKPVRDPTLHEPNVIYFNRGPLLNNPHMTEMAAKGPAFTFVAYANRRVYAYVDPGTPDGSYFYTYGPIEESSYD